ncbi:TetR/AcrR family transcriptional regulator C-terminal domain-containing protein [Mycobacterium talmoniae]|uniref:Tetracycline repressor protein class E n=1 Tax=Mycobacterium talmoniae TaxID=1858794 RepID=A0A2S8BFJ2_9MYCO|nr:MULTISPECIES: TetR/AcrR family transcriptional regulator C-terminal domain-containing protein [Mycobacterium]PQM45395.1 Tetracycline repressor protein class E [Mycobacterium talmoniae]TDH49344.1 TetR family transcriptional regulator [Mycobacterium eburneum]
MTVPGPVRRPGRPSLLTPSQVAHAAFDLVDAEGPGALTIARLAKELGVRPMTIYGYAASKDEIVTMVADLLLADLPPVDLRQRWQTVLEKVFLSIYRRFLDHRNVTLAVADAPVFGRAQAEVIERVLMRLHRAGFSPEAAFHLQRTLATYTLGFAIFAIVESRAGADRPRAAWSHLDVSEFPHLSAVSTLFGTEVTEAQYLRGLCRIIGD